MEVIDPSSDVWEKSLISIAERMISIQTKNYVASKSVKRGLDYYASEGFEISLENLGAQKQLVGGGSYKQGIGFAIGFDRLMLANKASYLKGKC